MNRRKFIRTLGLSGLGLYLLPSFLRKGAKAFSLDEPEFIPAINWLYGSPQKGCSTSILATEFHGRIENGLDDWANFRFTS
jgi:predicted NAD/FAD-dependent oxidoreductase